MPAFRFHATVTVSAYTDVEADTVEEARVLAEGRAPVLSTGHDGHSAAEDWLIEDADGVPDNIRLGS